jgi:uncharacterized protein (DUF342 family)
MDSKIYSGSNVAQCLEIASKELGVAKEELLYTVLEEKRSLFKKSATISVQLSCDKDEKVKHGTISIKDGTITVKNPIDDGRKAVIAPSSSIKLQVDGEEIAIQSEVTEESLIEVSFDENEAKRHMDFSISSDRMKCYVTINYIPQITYKLSDSEESNILKLTAEIKKETYPPLYTVQEIKQELIKLGIKYGIIEENLAKCEKSKNITDLLIIEGKAPINDEDDIIELKFSHNGNSNNLIEDDHGRIDYKNIGSIEAVKKDTVIAVKVEGKQGVNGIDIYGNVIKKKEKRLKNLIAGDGCQLVDSNTIKATMDGKPCIKNNVFYVYALHEIFNDVDIKSGNIKFIGDVKIHGDVREGMSIDAGNSIEIEKGVQNAKLYANGNIDIRGNVINSTIRAGGEDVTVLRNIKELDEMRTSLTSMMETIMEIKKFNLLGQKSSDGEIIKLLIENKFKQVSRLCLTIIRDILTITNDKNDELVSIFREKLIGMAALGIKHFGELEGIIECIKRKEAQMTTLLALPVNIKLPYCQDTTVESSGDIYISGKGVYVSKIIAHGSLYFTEDRSVARGGELHAQKEIKCKVVGSTGGVATKLVVAARGHIWADVTFQNTILVVGSREYTIENPSRNLHAYMDNKGELIVDKLKL